VGIDRILFGSDGPFHDPRDAAQQVVALDLTDSERERILSRNAKDYLNID
jgi:predicted TIM-barrel fold metal-dependent hydrolase